MKMIYNGAPIKSLNIKHYEVSTNDCTMVPSDLQAGVTGVAKGKKIVGTGKSFEFAQYGKLKTNARRYVPNMVNIVEVASTEHPVKLTIPLTDMKNLDFTTKQNVGSVIIDNVEYPLFAQVVSNILTISCDKSFYLQLFYGKDNYI